MAKAPEAMKGLRLDEPFFNAVIKRAGGNRLTELHKPPKDTRNVDYLLHGWAVELKTLTADPLDAFGRQEKMRNFFRAEFPKGFLYVTATKREGRLTAELSRKYWIEIMGTSIQGALQDAEEQIIETRSFVPGPLPSMLLLVNTMATSWDWQSFVNMVSTYLKRRRAIDAVVAIDAPPEASDSKNDYILHTAYVASVEIPEADKLWRQIAASMNTEIQLRTKRASYTKEVDALSPGANLIFQFAPDGNIFRRKPKGPQ